MGKWKSVELQGLLKSLLYGLIACAILSVVIYFSPLEETMTGVLSRLILIASVFYAGCYASKFYGNKGLIRGATMGLLFFIVLLIASLLFQASQIDLKSFFVNLSLCLGAGAFGGILGIGLNAD